MADRKCAGPLIRRSEFQIVTDPVTGTTTRQFGLCGEDADASSLSSALGREVTIQETYTWMRNNGLADVGGASTLSGNLACCTALGGVVVDSLPYSSTLSWTDVLAFLRKHAGIDPIVFETSIGQALVDMITGSGENAVNLRYHFVPPLAYHEGGASDMANGRILPEGIWCADGCSFAGGNSNANGFNATDTLQFYQMSVVQAAALVGLFALKGRETMLLLSQVSSWFNQNTDGSWQCVQTGKEIRGGILSFYQTFQGSGTLYGFTDLGLPLTNEIAVGAISSTGIQPTIQVFERGALLYDPNHEIDNVPGATGGVFKAHINRPEVLAIVEPPAPPVVPPSVVFGPVTDQASAGSLTITVPYTIK